MKKKIKELTEQQIDKICDNHPLCDSCPLVRKYKDSFYCYGLYKDLWEDFEIELEEDELGEDYE